MGLGEKLARKLPGNITRIRIDSDIEKFDDVKSMYRPVPGLMVD
jgi:hypothetical protein